MKQLYQLEPAEVSLVPRGANKKKFIIYKEGDTQMNDELKNKIATLDPKVLEKIEAVIKAYGEKEGEDMDAKAQTALKAIIRIATPFKDQLGDVLEEAMEAAGLMPGDDDVEANASEGDRAQSVEQEDMEDDEEDKEDDSAMKSMNDMSDEHKADAHKDGMGAYEKAYKAKVKKLGYRMYPDAKPKQGEDKMDPVIKEDGTLDLSSVPEKVRPAVEAIYKGQQEAVKKAKELEESLAKEREIRITKEFEEKASSYKHLGADTKKLASIMKSMSGEQLADLESVLKANDEQIAKGKLFAEIGSSQSAQGSNAWETIEKAAAGHVAKSGEKVSKAEAVARFLETDEGKKMYAEHQASRKDGI